MTSDQIYILFKKGARVEVVQCRSYTKYDYKGKLGTVVTNQYGRYGKIIVALDDERNPYSGNGHFYFKPFELSLVNDNDNNDILEENDMAISNSNLVNYFNVVRIQYLDNEKQSSYVYANYEPDLKVGDLCVVKSAHHGLGLARVTEIMPENNYDVRREIVAKVYTDCYDERVEMRNKAAALLAKMEARAKQLQDIALYQMLAKDDPDMMQLLDEYQSIPKM